MKKYAYLLILALVIPLAGCTTTQKGASAGAVLGGAVGAIIGHQQGKGLEGTAIGAGVGALGGAAAGEWKKNKNEKEE